MVKGKLIVKIWLITGAIGLLFIIIWFSQIIPTPEEDINMAVNAYKIEEYEGLIVDKFIDRKEHNFKKVIINENNQQRVILFDIEISGLYDFLEIGDSIIKNKGELRVRVIRNELDTILKMKFAAIDETRNSY